MAKYLIRRFIQLVVVTLIISVLVFLLVHLLPGDPTTIILGANDTAHNRAVLLKQLGLNKPLVQQYFFSEVAQGRVQNLDHGTLPNGMPAYSFNEGQFFPTQIWLAS